MTWPPERIGDKGHRYEIRILNEETDEVKPLGWASTLEGAIEMRDAFQLRPGWEGAWIIDRQPAPPVNERSP